MQNAGKFVERAGTPTEIPDGYYKERYEAQRRLARKSAQFLEVNAILEAMRNEIKGIIPSAMEACILLLDPDARQYTRPLQCGFYDRPVNCQACKKGRDTIQKAINQGVEVLVSEGKPVIRPDGSQVKIGPEVAMPVMVDSQLVAMVNVVAKPGITFTDKDLSLVRVFSEAVGDVLLTAKQQWEMTQEKIRISQMLEHLLPFVPHSVRNIVEKDPELLNQEKVKREVSVLFLDMEDYTRLSETRPETEVNEIVEKIFSSFVDPIHRSRGDINETAGDGLMIIFKDDDPKTNAVNSIKAAFDIHDLNYEMNQKLPRDLDPISINMGINSGTALVGMTRFKGVLETRMTYTASGPVTNMAARLADYARGGDILIGEETRSLVDGLWPVYDRGTVQLKGIDHPVRIFSLINRD